MRKAFNFYRSYYDVLSELNDTEKLKFLMALFKKQFYGIEPELTGMAKFAYLSQKHSIDKQVIGYQDKTGEILHPTQGGTQGGTVDPCQQVQEKEKEEEKEQEYPFAMFWDMYGKKVGEKVCRDKWKRLDLKTRKEIIARLPDYIASKPDKQFRPNPQTFLNQERWLDEVPSHAPKQSEYKSYIPENENKW